MFWMEQYISIAPLKSKSERYSFTLFYSFSILNFIQLKMPSVTLISLNLFLYQTLKPLNLSLVIDQRIKLFIEKNEWSENNTDGMDFLKLWCCNSIWNDLWPKSQEFDISPVWTELSSLLQLCIYPLWSLLLQSLQHFVHCGFGNSLSDEQSSEKNETKPRWYNSNVIKFCIYT